MLVYEEDDPAFSVSIELTKSRKFILLNLEEERTSEVRYLATDKPTGELKVIEPRRRGVLYEVDHVGDRFFIRTNLDAPDFRIMRAPEATLEASPPSSRMARSSP
jgi:oligopeptidase B